MKSILRRREFLVGSFFGLIGLTVLKSGKATAAAPAITDKDILKEGTKGAPVSQYCENPTKQPNQFCTDAKARPGACNQCQFYTGSTETTFKGKKYAKCQIITTGPGYIAATGWCATFVKKAGA